LRGRQQPPNGRGERRATHHKHPHGEKVRRVARPLHCLVRLGTPPGCGPHSRRRGDTSH
jgi:hypothetical protein